MKKLLIGFLLIFTSSIYIYTTDIGYEKLKTTSQRVPLGGIIFGAFENIINEIDIVKKIKRNDLNDKEIVDLALSSADLKQLQMKLNEFIKEGFIRDEINVWRKAEVLIDGEWQDVRFKIHGTSVTPLRRSIGFWDKVKDRLGLQEKTVPINRGGYSVKIKHDLGSQYRNLMRRYNLITAYDEIEVPTIAINKIASHLGLIAPFGKMVILRINGSAVGQYMMVESHNKEWFERDHNLTNYSIIKSNDDWDHKGLRHDSDTDLQIQDKEISGTSINSDVALGALKLLFDAINNNDIAEVKRLIDVDYMSRFMALLTITNNSHPITGDNLRYIYDHSTGRFKLLFRVEDKIFLNDGNISEFNSKLFNTIEGYSGAKTHKLFKILVADRDFRQQRDKELFKIIEKKDELLIIANDVFDKNRNVMLFSSNPIRPKIYNVKRFKKIFLSNIEKAKKYIEYTKVYVSKFDEKGNQKKLSVINDSYHYTLLDKIFYFDSEGNNVTEERDELIFSPMLSHDLQMVHREQEFEVDSKIITGLLLRNSITGKVIDNRHIYINNISNFNSFDHNQSLNSLKINGIIYDIDNLKKSITIRDGSYILSSDLIIPKGYSAIIKPGASFKINEGDSFLVEGDLKAIGTEQSPIKFSRNNVHKPFGTIAVLGKEDNKSQVQMSHVDIRGGSEATVNGVSFSGQVSIHHAEVIINKSFFRDSHSDDGINIKYSKVDIKNSIFSNNNGDQIDLDYSSGSLSNNLFFRKP